MEYQLGSAGAPLHSAFRARSVQRCYAWGWQPCSRGAGAVGARHLRGSWDAAARLGASSDWGNEAATWGAACWDDENQMTLNLRSGSLACDRRYRRAVAWEFLSRCWETDALLTGCPVVFSCRGASGMGGQNCGWWLPCPGEVLTKTERLSENSLEGLKTAL